MGAKVIEANHPYMGYGYFNSRDRDMIPGGYDSGFELVEIEAAFHNGGQERNQRTIDAIWQLWNNRERKYLAAGSDAHDVWAEPSGAARTYVHIEGELTIDAYVDGLLQGHSFASQGPLIYPEIMFGSVVTHAAGEQLPLSYTLQAVSGLRSAQIVAGGEVVTQGVFRGETSPTNASWNVVPEADTWYSIIVEDNNGNLAYSNPIWVTVVD